MHKLIVIHPVKNVDNDGYRVEVTFTDRHQAIFTPYTHGFGYGIEGLRGFMLFAPDKARVCEFNGRLYRAGPCEDEYKLVFLAEGYDQQRVAAYWDSAKAHVHNLFWRVDDQADGEHEPDQNSRYAWVVTSATNGTMFGLEPLKKGILQKANSRLIDG